MMRWADNLANQDIRGAASAAGIRLWEVAKAAGISDNTLTRRLRTEMPEDDKQILLDIIKKLADGIKPTVSKSLAPGRWANRKVRERMRETGMAQWQIAYEMGISQPTLSRMLSRELPEQEQNRLIGVINNLAWTRGVKDEVK